MVITKDAIARIDGVPVIFRREEMLYFPIVSYSRPQDVFFGEYDERRAQHKTACGPEYAMELSEGGTIVRNVLQHIKAEAVVKGIVCHAEGGHIFVPYPS